MKFLHKRSGVVNKLPEISVMDYGEIAINYAQGSEGIFFKNNNDDIIAIKPTKHATGNDSTSPISQKKFTEEINKLKEEVETNTVRTTNGVYIKENNAIYEGTDNNLNITAHKDIILNATSGDMSSLAKFKVSDEGVTLSEYKSRVEKDLFKIQTSQNNTTLNTDKNIVLDGKSVYTKSSMYIGGNPEDNVIDNNYKFCVGGNACIYGNLEQSSDESLKNIHGEVVLNVEDIAKIRAVKYTWKDDNVKPHIGTIAQDWQKILPESVSENKDKTLALDYNGTLMCAVISLSKEIVKQNKIIETLQNEINNLKKNGN